MLCVHKSRNQKRSVFVLQLRWQNILNPVTSIASYLRLHSLRLFLCLLLISCETNDCSFQFSLKNSFFFFFLEAKCSYFMEAKKERLEVFLLNALLSYPSLIQRKPYPKLVTAFYSPSFQFLEKVNEPTIPP